jgi:putative transposase
MYLAESGFAARAHRTYGYALKGRRSDAAISAHTRPRTALLAARDETGMRATWLCEGTCTAAVFNQWLETELARTLTANDVVVMDNAAFHKTPETQRIINAAGAAVLSVPPSSPDRNPIEHDFAAIKNIRPYDHTKPLDEIVRDNH